MKYKKITILIILAMILFIYSLSTISAANNTINDTSTGGIAKGITDTDPNDTLFLEEGTYNKTSDRGITINKNITIQGKGPTNKVIIDAQKLSRIFAIANGLNVTFINITFINGKNATGDGGAIYNSYASTRMTAINCIFTNNQAINTTTATDSPGKGGAIYNYGHNTIINGCIFINNTAQNRGGAVCNGGSNLTINESSFINNSAVYAGGAFHSVNIAHNITVSRCNFTNNYGSAGGGFQIVGNSAYVIESNFINNTGDYAGSIYLSGANNTVIKSNFINNSATNFSGGAIINTGVNMLLTASNFTNNNAINLVGGAFYNSGGNQTTSYCIFNGNKAASFGGAIFNRGNMSLSGNTMSGNSAGLGQMIYNNGTMGILNLTFIDNSTLIVKNGSTITLYAILVDDVGNTVTGQNISFYLNGVLYENVESIEGKASINYTVSSTSGDIPVSGLYAGNGVYDILINNGLLQVRIPTKITISVPQEVKVGDKVILESKLTDENGNPIAGKTVDFYVDGKKVGSGVTDADGIAKLNYTFTKAGKPNVVAKFAGDNTYISSNATNSTTVSKIPTNITVKTDKDTIAATRTDEDGNPLANKTITITVNGKTYTKTTNSKGQVIIKYKKAWDYKVTANFAENNKYLGSKDTAPKRTPTKLTIKKRRQNHSNTHRQKWKPNSW